MVTCLQFGLLSYLAHVGIHAAPVDIADRVTVRSHNCFGAFPCQNDLMRTTVQTRGVTVADMERITIRCNSQTASNIAHARRHCAILHPWPAPTAVAGHRALLVCSRAYDGA